MALPDARIIQKDGGLGLSPPPIDNIHIKVGTCSGGTQANNDPLQVTNIGTATEAFGTAGPLIEAIALHLALGGGPVIAVRTPMSVAGVAGAVTKTATTLPGKTTGTSVVTVTGSPLDSYRVRVRITSGSSVARESGLAKFQYSLDGGQTYSSDVQMLALDGAYSIANTGLTITFGAGTVTEGDIYVFDTTGPGYSMGELLAALDAVQASTLEGAFLHVVGAPAGLTAAASLFTTVDLEMADWQANYRFCNALIPAPQENAAGSGDTLITDTTVRTAFQALSSALGLTAVAYGTEDVTSALSGWKFRRNISWSATAHLTTNKLSDDLGRVASGAIRGVTKIYRDEANTPGMDDARFITARHHIGLPGYYFTRGRTMAAPGSDFTRWQYRAVMNTAARAIRAAMLPFVLESVLVNTETGGIAEIDAKRLEAVGLSALRNAVVQPGYATEATVTIDRTVDVIATSKLVVRYRLIGLAYADYIENEIGFSNPAITKLAA